MDDKKQEYPKFTPTVPIKTSYPFINKTENTRNTVKFECTGVTHKDSTDIERCKTCKYFDFSDLDTNFCELHNQLCENIKDCKDYSEIIGIHSRDKQTKFKSRCIQGSGEL